MTTRSAELLRAWRTQHASRALDANRVQRTSTYADPATGLEVRCVAVAYHDFPTVEWTVYFRNAGQSDTPLLENIQALDLAKEDLAQIANELHRVAQSLFGAEQDRAPGKRRAIPTRLRQISCHTPNPGSLPKRSATVIRIMPAWQPIPVCRMCSASPSTSTGYLPPLRPTRPRSPAEHHAGR